VPDGFLVGLKVPEDVTVAKWPGHSQYGERAGHTNPNFLDPALFRLNFVKRLEPHAAKVGPLIFEFGTFAKAVFPRPDDFLFSLDDFLDALPTNWQYAVEIRNADYLGPGYFTCLNSHGVAHVFNAWTRMPELGKQAEMEGAFTADFTVVRALLAKGRTYEAAVKEFQPYDRIQEPNEPARRAIARIVERIKRKGAQGFMFVNNRLEGFAPGTIEAIVEEIVGGS
jgi:uncharacterized protein YecE (DUF72 family)